MSEKDSNQNEIIESAVNTQEEYKDEYAEFGTIFSDPSAHREKKTVSSTKKGVRAIIATAVALAIVVGSIFAIVKFVPRLSTEDDNNTDMLFSDTMLFDNELSELASITVTNSNGTFTFLSEEVETTDSSGGTSTAKRWYVQGMDKDLVDSETIKEKLQSAAKLTVKRTVDTKTPEQCGFGQPKYTVKVLTDQGAEYTIYVGADSPDNTGTYVMSDSSDDIYIAYDTAIENFNFALLDLANSEPMAAAKFSTSVVSYCDDLGVLNTFDTLKISGKNFDKPLVITPNKDESISAYVGYTITSPIKRYADTDGVDAVFSIFSDGLAADGAYAFDVSPSSLAAVGLDNPDMTVQLTIAGESKTFKISIVDDNYFAVVNDESKMIKKVALNTASFVTYGPDDLYSSFVFIRTISDVSNMTVSHGEKTYSFDITSVKGEDDKAKLEVSCNGKKITYSYFQNLYQEAVGLTVSDYSTEAISAQPDMTLSFTNAKSGEVTTIRFYKCSATKYQYSIDGVPLGKIVSSSYNKIVKYAANVAADKDING